MRQPSERNPRPLWPYTVAVSLAMCAGPVEPANLHGDGGATTQADGGQPPDSGDAGIPGDAGPGDDAGPWVDAGPRSDAGAQVDGGTRIDAGAPVDSGIRADAGARVDGGPPGDAGAEGDAGAKGDAGHDAGSGTQGDGGAAFDAGAADATITVDLAHPGTVVPDDFLGLSVEWSAIPTYLGDGGGQPRPEVLALLGHFAVDGHHPVLRIGGNSEDVAFWNPTGLPDPSGDTVNISQEHLSILAAINAATQSHVILGLNLAQLDPTNEAALVTAALGALPAGAIDAFELGNEPDLYFYPQGYRQFGYSAASYQTDFDSYFPQLSTAASNQPLFAAPSESNSLWYSSLPSFLSAETGRLALVTQHYYPFTNCFGQLFDPTLPSLFSAAATTEYATLFQPEVQAAAQAGLGLRVAEMNSVSCGGLAGVSDVFAAGLWGLDAMFQLASVGAVGMNFHTPSAYAVFDFDGLGNLEVRGLYYAMLFFSRATASEGQLVPVTVHSGLQIRAWATLGSDLVARVAIVNEELVAPATVQVTAGSRAKSAQLWALTAPALDAGLDITFGSETFAGSLDGNPIGSDAGTAVTPTAGQYEVTLGPGSAALLAVPP